MRLSAEAVFWVRAAAGRRLGSSSLAPVEPADWSAVRVAAGRNHLEPLLFDLVERGLITVPADIRAGWEDQYYRNQIFNNSVFELLERILTLGAEKGVRIIVLKGPVSIARRLRDPGLRIMVDLDLLCRQADLAVLAEIALGLGFSAVGENAIYHLAFQHPRCGVGLELHFDLYEVLAERGLFLREVAATAEDLNLGGLSIPAPSLPVEVVLQLAHLLNHDYRVDLRHWLDFALAVAEIGSEEARVQRELARWLRLTDLEPEYHEATAIAGHLFGVPLGSSDPRAAPAALRGIEAGLLDLRDDRALLAGARVHRGWWPRLRYVIRLLVPAPRRWRSLAVAEETGVSKALFRHLSRAIGRGRTKVAHQSVMESTDPIPAPSGSPRARLYRRRRVGG